MADSAQGIQVTFLDQTGAKSVQAIIAPTVTVQEIIPNLITKMNLPTQGPDGSPMTYSLDYKEGGRRLLAAQTLQQAGVQENHHLIIYPEIVAGLGGSPASCLLHPAPSEGPPKLEEGSGEGSSEGGGA